MVTPLKLRRVPKFYFMMQMNGLNLEDYSEIANFISNNKGNTTCFWYGGIPGKYLYRIDLSDGTNREWSLDDIKPIRVPKFMFIRRMKGLIPGTHAEIAHYLYDYSERIKSFWYGHLPGERLYRIILDDNTEREWRMTRRVI